MVAFITWFIDLFPFFCFLCSHAEFFDFCGRIILIDILGEHVYASGQFLQRGDTIEVLTKTQDNESSDIWFIGIEEGNNGFSKITFLRVTFGEFSTHFEVLSFLAHIREFSQLNGHSHLLIRLVQKLAPYGSPANYSRGDWMELIREIISAEKVLVIIDDVYQGGQIKKLVRMPAGMLLGDRVLITVTLLVTIRGKAVLSITPYIVVGEYMPKQLLEELDLGKLILPDDDYESQGFWKTRLCKRILVNISGIWNCWIDRRNLNLQLSFKEVKEQTSLNLS